MTLTAGAAGQPAPGAVEIVLAGATGDLCRRKLLPAIYGLLAHGRLAPGSRVIATAPEQMSSAGYAEIVRAALCEHSPFSIGGSLWDQMRSLVTYVPSRPAPGGMAALAASLAPRPAARVVYLAVPPQAFASLTTALVGAGIAQDARVAYEKPFGATPEACAALRALVDAELEADQVFAVDHFLAKPAVAEITHARFAPDAIDDWSRDTVARVVIDVPETIGICARASFYEQTGALRDMVITHLFNLVGVVAMERPASFAATDLADARAAVLRAVRPIRHGDLVRGQYAGYRSVAGVDPASSTETFVALRLAIDNDRWAGVPFLLRTGKRLASGRQTITIIRRPTAPRRGCAVARCPGAERAQSFDLRAAADSSAGANSRAPLGAYENVLLDVVAGVRRSSAGVEAITRAWEIADRVLQDPPTLHRYEDGSRGPVCADRLLALPRATAARRRRWRSPGSACAKRCLPDKPMGQAAIRGPR